MLVLYTSALKARLASNPTKRPTSLKRFKGGALHRPDLHTDAINGDYAEYTAVLTQYAKI
jgi:hypothetical protein